MIFIQDLDNLDETKTAGTRNDCCNCSSSLVKNERINDQQENTDFIEDSDFILSNFKHACENENSTQKYKSCVLAATLAIGATSTEFENQEAKNNGEKVFEYLNIDQESNECMKKG